MTTQSQSTEAWPTNHPGDSMLTCWCFAASNMDRLWPMFTTWKLLGRCAPNCWPLGILGAIRDRPSSKWLEAPKSRRGNRYFHSKEAIHNKGNYADWDYAKVSALVVDLMNALGR